MSRINLKHILILNLTSDKLSPKTLIHDTIARVCNCLISFLLASLITAMWTKSMSIAFNAPNSKTRFSASKVDEMWRKNFLVALSFVSVVCARCHKNFWTPEILWEINVWLNSNLRCLLIRVRLPRNVWNFRKIFFNASTKSQNATENAMISKRNSFRQQLEYSSLYCHEVEKQPFGKVWVTDAIHFTWDVFARTYVYVSGVCSF